MPTYNIDRVLLILFRSTHHFSLVNAAIVAHSLLLFYYVFIYYQQILKIVSNNNDSVITLAYLALIQIQRLALILIFKTITKISMFQTDFLSPYSIDQSKIVKIPLSQFLINVGLDIGIIIFSFLVWKYIIWVPIQKMTIPNVATGNRKLIDKATSVLQVIRMVRGILREMIGKGDVLIKNYGLEYFAYLMFLRRLCLIMGILIITDICIWIPYCLFFEPFTQFSLITMPSDGNNDFRTFYTIYVAFIVLYGIHDLKLYLYTMFMYRNFRCQSRILNNLKTKTLHMEFIDSRFDSTTSIKAQMQKYLVEDMKQEDRVLAVKEIPLESELLEYQYRHKITKIISEYGVNNLSWFWKFFKEQTAQSIQTQRLQNLQKVKSLIEDQRRRNNDIKSCMIIVSRIETAQKLCQKFEIGRALCNVCPDFGYSGGQAMWRVKNQNMIVRWAQDPKDLIWINMGYHQKQLFNFALFNALCALLLLISFFFIAITSTDTYIKMPTIIGPAILITFNSTLRFLISKMVQWQRKTLRSEWQIKQFKMTVIYLLLNVILISIVRDTLNLLGLLQTGWGWIELFSLIYKKTDGLFYYILILNQTVSEVFSALVKFGDIFLDCFQASLWYQKVTRVKRLPRYGRNDTFRLGYSYSIVFIILAVILLYSVSCPLIHFFGLIFFYTKMHLDTFTICVFHEQQIVSNMRFTQRVVQSISTMVGAWIFLTATSLTFSSNYSNSIILYIFFGIVIYYASTLSKVDSFKDYETDYVINNENIRKDIDQWKRIYTHPFKQDNYLYDHQPQQRMGLGAGLGGGVGVGGIGGRNSNNNSSNIYSNMMRDNEIISVPYSIKKQ